MAKEPSPDLRPWQFSLQEGVVALVENDPVSALENMNRAADQALGTGLEAVAYSTLLMLSALLRATGRKDEAESARRRAEDHLRAIPPRGRLDPGGTYRALFDSNPEAMWLFDRETLKFLEVNRTAIERYGYSREEFLEMTILDIRPEEDRRHVRDQLKAPGPQMRLGGTWRHLTKDGSVRWVEIISHELEFRGRPAIFVLVHDITKRMQLEERLRLSQRLASVGRLAGGIAHDFNNLLSVIFGYCELLKSRTSDPEMQEGLHEILMAGQRAEELTRQLLAFSRKQVLEPQILQLNGLVANMEKMLRRLIGEDIRLVTRLDPGLGAIRADPGQIEQVIVNLVINARDALPKGGRITLETSTVLQDDESARRHLSATTGRHVLLAVSDNGTGMDAETRKHIFEPFFSTKKEGHGTGLGLATVYGIVKQSEGSIWVYSELGLGTTFKIYLPEVESGASAVDTGRARPAARGGTETILVVEDEQNVRKLIRRRLEEAGYTVLAAADATEAFALASNDRTIALVLTDVVLTGMDGRTLVNSLEDSHPGIKALFMSGYTEDAIVHHGILEPGFQFLPKPFSPESLLAKVRQALDA
jgi:two-component system cell cycle sensor histidine kinase/response regulator CckA